jgi:Transposase DDE domain
MGYIRNIIVGSEIKEKSRLSEKDFTRSRKVGFVTLVCMILNMIKKSTQLEIDDFMKKFGTDDNRYSTYTKQSFSEARQKLSPEAFKILNNGFVQKYYEDNDYKKYKGFRLLAVDASSIEVPNTKELRDHYGCAGNSNAKQKAARAQSSTLYDLENRIVLNSLLGRYDDSERELAQKNIDEFDGLSQGETKDLVLFDRGYPSIEFIMYLKAKGISFLMRTASTFFAEVVNTKTQDEVVEIEVTKERMKTLRRRGKLIPAGTTIKLRVVKVTLKTGEIETLITDLGEDVLKYEEFKGLYFRRWGIETKFDELKNKFQIENFSGVKPMIIEQDFYAILLLSNIASIFEQEAQEELKEKNEKKNLKYEYKINKNILVGKLKDSLIEMLLEQDGEKKGLLYNRFINEVKRNVVPIIKERAFERKWSCTNKHSKTRRRAF